jgi:hypothetical protein
LVYGEIIKEKPKEYSNIRMEKYTKGSFKMTKSMEKECSNRQMVDTIKANGKKIRSMAKAYSIKMKLI